MQNAVSHCLLSVSNSLDTLGVKWFLNGGCCLGYVRNGELISHDPDVDISIYASEEEVQKILNLLPVCKIRYFRNRVCEATAYIANVQVDIFFLFEFGDYIVENISSESENRVKLLGYNKDIIEDGLRRAFIEGIEVNVLKRSADYCNALYGDGYMIPNKNWNSWRDPFNCIHEEPIVDLYSLSTWQNNNFIEKLKWELSWINNILLFSYNLLSSVELGLNCSIAITIFYYEYARIFNYHPNQNFADFQVDLICSMLNKELPLSMKSGLIGIDWGFRYLIQNKFLDSDEENLFSELEENIEARLILKRGDISTIIDMGIYYLRKKKLTRKTNQIFQTILYETNQFIHSLHTGKHTEVFVSYDLIVKLAYVNMNINIIIKRAPSPLLMKWLNSLIVTYREKGDYKKNRFLDHILGLLSLTVSIGMSNLSKSLKTYFKENDWISNEIGSFISSIELNNYEVKSLLRIIHLCNWIIQRTKHSIIEKLKLNCLKILMAKDTQSNSPFQEYRGQSKLSIEDGIVGIGFVLLLELKESEENDLHFSLLL